MKCTNYDSGCAYCKAEDSNECLLCRFGYSMNENGSCSKNDDFNTSLFPTDYIIPNTFDSGRTLFKIVSSFEEIL